MQVDPDLSRVAGPVESYGHVLHDPFGFGGLQTGLRYPGAGRAMAHLTTKAWADHALGWVHVFVSDPVRALYLGLAITAVLVHLGFLVVGCKYLRAYQPMTPTATLCCALGLSLFVQLATQRFYVGIIDHSMSYTFAYAIPLLVLASFFLPVYRSLLHSDYIPSVRVAVTLVLASFYLAFSGPLVQPCVALLGVLLVVVQLTRRTRLLVHQRLLPGLGTLGVLSAWGMYLSQFNSESVTAVTVGTRYKLLRHGLFEVLIRPSSPWVLLLVAIGLLYRFGSRSAKPEIHRQLKVHLAFGLGFGALWLGLLPLGGYRNYRPFILSSVTLLPVTLIVVYLFVLLVRVSLSRSLDGLQTDQTGVVTSATRSERLHGPMSARSSRPVAILTFGVPVVVLSLLALHKFVSPPTNNACQRKVFEQLRSQSAPFVSIPRTCPILTETVGALDDPDYLQAITKLLRRWEILRATQTLK